MFGLDIVILVFSAVLALYSGSKFFQVREHKAKRLSHDKLLEDEQLAKQQEYDRIDRQLREQERLEREKIELPFKLEREKLELPAKLERQRLEQEARLRKEEEERQAQIEREKLELPAKLERERLELEARIEKEREERQRKEEKAERVRLRELQEEQEAKDRARQKWEKSHEGRRHHQVAATQAVLDAGYTMQQLLDWAFSEIHFDPLNVDRLKLRTDKTRGPDGNWQEFAVFETEEEALKRLRHNRYLEIREYLLGRDEHELIAGRDLLKAMKSAGVFPEHHLCEACKQKSEAWDVGGSDE